MLRASWCGRLLDDLYAGTALPDIATRSARQVLCVYSHALLLSPPDLLLRLTWIGGVASFVVTHSPFCRFGDNLLYCLALDGTSTEYTTLPDLLLHVESFLSRIETLLPALVFVNLKTG